MAIPDKENI